MADVKTLIPAGGTITLRRVGDFVFCKFSDRELILDIKDGEGNSDGPVRVKNGSMRRPPGGVSEIEVTNPDQDNPCAAVFFIGKGDFDDKVIQGEVTVNPGVRGADGRWRDDTRRELEGILWPVDLGKTYPQGEEIFRTRGGAPSSYSKEYISYHPNGYIVKVTSTSSVAERVAQYFDYRLNLVAEMPISKDVRFVPHGSPFGAEDWGLFSVTPIDIIAYKNGFLVVVGGPGRPAFPGCIFFSEGEFLEGFKKFEVKPNYLMSVTVDDTGLVYCLFSDGEVLVLDEGGDIVATKQVPAGWSGELESIRHFGGKFYIGVDDFNDSLMVLNSDFELLNTYNLSTWQILTSSEAKVQGMTVVAGLLYSRDLAGNKIVAVPLEDIVSPLTLTVESYGECAELARMTWRREDYPVIDAELEVSRSGDLLVVRGECVKAALAAMTGRRVQGDYLDSVYSFEYATGKSWNRKVSRKSGGRSFKGAKIADSFVMTLPTRVRVSVDDTLELSDPELTL